MDLSIIIPTLNRSASLRKTLLSIIDQQGANGTYEVIVVDNGSLDETNTVCLELGKQIKNFIYQYDGEPGLLTGRHKGALLSSGSILSFIDDDVELNPYWCKTVIHHFLNNKETAILGGPSLPKYHMYPPSWIKHFWQPTPYGGSMCLPLSLIDIGADHVEIDPLYVFGLNYSIRKKVMLDLGGFHPDCIPEHLQQYQGDGESGLSIKARNKNLKAVYISSAFLYHQVAPQRMTSGYFEKWHYYNGICNSFTDIRIKHDLYTNYRVTIPDSQTLFARVRNKSLRIIKSVISKRSVLPDDVIQYQSCFHKRYMDGYKFHQQAFTTDIKVKNWVLKPDYWNYSLPI